MTKNEAETAIRHLCHVWRRDTGQSATADQDLSFQGFYIWLNQNHSPYLKFRTSTSVSYDVELWFDQEFKQAGQR